jgi:hypothetical protein
MRFINWDTYNYRGCERINYFDLVQDRLEALKNGSGDSVYADIGYYNEWGDSCVLIDSNR